MLTLTPPGQVELPPGFELLEIRQSDKDIGFSRMNNCGQVVFSEDFLGKGKGDIVLYDNGTFTRITDSPDEVDWTPDIGDSGTIVWEVDGGFEPQFSEVRMLRGGQQRTLALGSSPKINRADHLTWIHIIEPYTCRFESHVFFYDGVEVRQITDGHLSNQTNKINDFDEIGWTEFDFCEGPWLSNIIFYSDGVPIIINEERHQWQGTVINNLGQVSYTGPPGLFLWEDGQTTRIFDATCCADLNNLGDVCHNFQEDHRQGDMYVLKVVGNERVTYRLTDDPINEYRCSMNDWGELVWTASDWRAGDYRLRFLRRIRTGDSEFDGDIDHDDLARLVDCMTGPMWVERTDPGPEDSLCECRFLDINHDGSVDLRDYAMFQQNFGG
jgi:hypothetical protein